MWLHVANYGHFRTNCYLYPHVDMALYIAGATQVVRTIVRRLALPSLQIKLFTPDGPDPLFFLSGPIRAET